MEEDKNIVFEDEDYNGNAQFITQLRSDEQAHQQQYQQQQLQQQQVLDNKTRNQKLVQMNLNEAVGTVGQQFNTQDNLYQNLSSCTEAFLYNDNQNLNKMVIMFDDEAIHQKIQLEDQNEEDLAGLIDFKLEQYQSQFPGGVYNQQKGKEFFYNSHEINNTSCNQWGGVNNQFKQQQQQQQHNLSQVLIPNSGGNQSNITFQGLKQNSGPPPQVPKQFSQTQKLASSKKYLAQSAIAQMSPSRLNSQLNGVQSLLSIKNQQAQSFTSQIKYPPMIMNSRIQSPYRGTSIQQNNAINKKSFNSNSQLVGQKSLRKATNYQRVIVNRINRFNLTEEEQEIYYRFSQILSTFEEPAMLDLVDCAIKEANNIQQSKQDNFQQL